MHTFIQIILELQDSKVITLDISKYIHRATWIFSNIFSLEDN